MALPHHSHYHEVARLCTESKSRHATSLPAACTSQPGGCCPHTPQNELSGAGQRLHMHSLAPGPGEPTPSGLRVNSSQASTQRHRRKPVPTGPRGGQLELLSGRQPGCCSDPCSFWSCCGAVEGLVLRPCSTGRSGVRARLHAAGGHGHTERAPGRKRRRLFTGTQHMQRKQHTARQGERRDFYLFSPSSPGISKPWPRLSVLPARDSRGLSEQMGWSVRPGLRCGSAGSVAWSSTGLRGWPAGCLLYRGAAFLARVGLQEHGVHSPCLQRWFL